MHTSPTEPLPGLRRVLDDAAIDEVAALARAIWPRHYAAIIGEAQTAYMLEQFQSPAAIRRQLADGFLYFLAGTPGAPADGYCALVAGRDRRLLLSKLYVREEARRRGLGRAMVAFAERRGQALGLRELWLTVNRRNADSIAFYDRAGFTVAGTQRQEIGGGFVMDDYVLGKPLGSRRPSDAIDRSRGCLLGLAAGDAVGTTAEFKARGTFAPLTDMTGGGPFGLQPGQWTDDTSLALCLAESLAETGRFDPRDQMERYVRWYRHGHRSSTGVCFDIGGTTAAALQRFERSGEPFAGSEDSAASGNGSLMRLAPVPILLQADPAQAAAWAGESSRTTHGSRECIDACRLFGWLLARALSGVPGEDLLSPREAAASLPGLSPRVAAIAAGSYLSKEAAGIRGSGYVVACLEAALWCFHRAGSFRDAVLMAANLGDDADTTAAVTGQIAGAVWGESGMPGAWVDRLAMATGIRTLADRLCGLPAAGRA